MKLKQLTLSTALVALLSSAAWADDLEVVPASEEIQVLASINDASAAMPVEMAANETAEAEATTTEATPADEASLEEIMQVCETAAKEEGVAPEGMDDFVKNCVAENGGSLEDDSTENSTSEADIQVDEQIADADVEVVETADTLAEAAPEAVLGDELAGNEEMVEGEVQPVADMGEGIDDQSAYVMTGNEIEPNQQ
ncbi:MAG: hypothetical protein RLZZ422_764 [Pseudomonadota bacterium]|jgi:hypothetical protein